MLKARAVAPRPGCPRWPTIRVSRSTRSAGAPGRALGALRTVGRGADRDACSSVLRDAEDRRARFRCVVALAWPDGRLEQAEGVCAGRIAERTDGAGGFGYDPLFVADELGRTFAAATAEEKARVSHRARAVRALGERLGAGSARPSGP